MSCRVYNVGVNRLKTFTPRVICLRPWCFSSYRHNSSVSSSFDEEVTTVNSSRYTYGIKGYGSHAPPLKGAVPLWTETLFREVEVPLSRQIFCNRALNMRDIKAVGFDMDYTLAQYLPQSFEQRAYYEAQKRLVHRFGYPAKVANLKFQWDYMTKGLVVDKVLGNVLKVDRHNYVKMAYHGFRELSSDERKRLYRDTQRNSEAFSEASYAMVDTLFSLAESFLFMQLVEMKDRRAHAFFERKAYRDMYMDLRMAVDMCHRDGSLKRAVAADPGKYMHPDPHLKDMLETLRRSGRRVFLATNSLWDYTNVVMNFMLFGKSGAARDPSWLSMFDLVLVGCAKPGFFQHRAPLFQVDVDTGLLRNTDNGAPVIPIDMDDIPSQTLAGGSLAAAEGGERGAAEGFGNGNDNGNGNGNSDTTINSNGSSRENGGDAESSAVGSQGNGGRSVGSGFGKQRIGEPAAWTGITDPKERVFQGGCFVDLHNMLGVESGSEVLYAGDHIYGDILKSKRAVGWRTMLVVPELELELELLAKSRHTMASLKRLRRARDDLDDKIQRLRRGLVDYEVPNDDGDSSRSKHGDSGKGEDCAGQRKPNGNGRSSGFFSLADQGGRDVAKASSSSSSSPSSSSCLSPSSMGSPHRVGSSNVSSSSVSSSSSFSLDLSSGASLNPRPDASSSASGQFPAGEAAALRSLLSRLETERTQVKARQARELRQHHIRFHPVWGQVMKTGYQNSRFAHQVERYACLYTSHVANLAFVSPDRSFAGRMDYLAHELEQ